MLRGWRPGRQIEIQGRCHVSSVYPAARVFAFGSTCMRARGRGEYKSPVVVWGPESSTATRPRGKMERGSLQHRKIYEGTFRWGKNACTPGRTRREGAREREREQAWRLFYFQQSGKCLAAHCPAPGGPGTLSPMRRPTAGIAWAVQPMRPPQRDRGAESPASSLSA